MFRSISDSLSNLMRTKDEYHNDSEAVIVACFFNPEKNPYRIFAFYQWYKRIKHLNHRIIECLIGPDAEPELPKSEFITQVRTESLLWHKEALLNRVIADLPSNFKYIFWLDTDIIFTNPKWMVEAVRKMRAGANIVQPFEYCVHLEQNQLTSMHDPKTYPTIARHTNKALDGKKRVWRSFCANYATSYANAHELDYDRHGHVGFAWGAKREVLDQCPLFDKALIGGADHIMAHAATGVVNHNCILKAFNDQMDTITPWATKFAQVVDKRIDYAKGDLWHIWHGDVSKREYLKRIQEFSPAAKQVTKKDSNGLYVAPKDNKYMEKYYRHREVHQTTSPGRLASHSDDFYSVMGYHLFWNAVLHDDRHHHHHHHSDSDQNFFSHGQEPILHAVGGIEPMNIHHITPDPVMDDSPVGMSHQSHVEPHVPPVSSDDTPISPTLDSDVTQSDASSGATSENYS
jgi:hypothetical protein